MIRQMMRAFPNREDLFLIPAPECQRLTNRNLCVADVQSRSEAKTAGFTHSTPMPRVFPKQLTRASANGTACGGTTRMPLSKSAQVSNAGAQVAAARLNNTCKSRLE